MAGFREMMGQEGAIAGLKTAIAAGRVSHAYLLIGDRGMGKRTLARAFAETLQCETLQQKLEEDESGGEKLHPEEIDACGRCKSCRQAETDNQPDIITWTYQKDTSISVDDIRSLVGDVQIKPYASRYKIYILPDVQKMTREAQNALLKTLEEPPEYAVLLLLTTSREAMLETILSRCVSLPLRPVDPAKIQGYLEEKHGIEAYRAEICTAFAQGNLGRAVDLATSDEFSQVLEEAIRILTLIRGWDMAAITNTIQEMDRDKDRAGDLLSLFEMWYRDVLFFKATREADGILFKDQIVQIREAARKSAYDGVQKILEAIKTARIRLKANVNFDLVMELLLLTMKEN